MLADAEGQRPWLAYAPVQIDKTAESLAEMQREISSYVDGEVPATQAEVEKIVANNLRSQPGAYETAGSVLGTIAGIVRYDRPDNWVELRNAQRSAEHTSELQSLMRTSYAVFCSNKKTTEDPLNKNT